MSSIAETIDIALAAVGPETEGRLRDVVAEFEALTLAAEERVSALATAIADVLVERFAPEHVTVRVRKPEVRPGGLDVEFAAVTVER